MTIAVHSFLADLPIFEAEVEAIAESIAEVGLLHPITLDTDGQVIGGRHRLAACEKAGIEPTFETYGGDPLAFVLHDNATRKHHSVGQRAAEVALALDAAGLRGDSRWKYGEVRESFTGKDSDSGVGVGVSKCGLILDILGRDQLVQIASGEAQLRECYERAVRARDSANELLAEQERIEAEEAAALEALPAEYAKQIGDTYSSARVAFAAWEDANRAEVARLRKEREKEAQAKRDHDDGMKREAGYLSTWTAHYALAAGMRDHPHRDEVLAAMLPKYRAEFLALEAANDWRTA